MQRRIILCKIGTFYYAFIDIMLHSTESLRANVFLIIFSSTAM